MANKKITALTELAATPAAGDMIPVVDVSDTTGAATGTTKRVSVDNLISEVAVADLAATAVVTEAEGIGSNDNDTSLPTSAAVKDYVDTQMPTDTFGGLNDTNISGPVAGHVAIYDGTDTWDNKAISGDATLAATGALTVGNDKITYAKMQDVSATDRILGRDTAGAGDVEEITPANVRTMLNVADGANNYTHPNHTGDVTSVADGATTIAAGVVTYAKMQDVSATDRILGRDTAGAGDVEEITPANLRTMINVADGANNYTHPNHSGDVTSVADGATTIANDAVTYAKMQNVSATDRILGRDSVGAGDVEEITPANLRTMINVADGANNYSHPNHSGDVTSVADGATTIAAGVVTYAKMQDVSATDKLLGRSTAGAGDVEEIACTAAGRALIDDANAAAQRTTLGLGALATKATVATADIDNDAVTYAKMQNVSATDRLLGRDTAGAGDVEEITPANVKTMLSLNNVENTALSTWAGTANITTVGTVTTGTWNGTAIDGAYLDIEGTEVKSTGETGATKYLREDGDGTCSWQAVTATATPGGSDGQVQYNDGGSMGGASNCYWDDVNNRLGVGISAPVYRIHSVQSESNRAAFYGKTTGGTGTVYGVKAEVTGSAHTNSHGGYFNAAGTATAKAYGVTAQSAGTSQDAYGGYFTAGGSVSGNSYGTRADSSANRNAGNHYGIYANSTVADVSGTRSNYGGYFKASGATTNRAIYAAGGDVLFDNNSGVTKFKFDAANGRFGFGTTNPSYFIHSKQSDNGGRAIYGETTGGTGTVTAVQGDITGAAHSTSHGGYFYAGGTSTGNAKGIYGQAAGTSNQAYGAHLIAGGAVSANSYGVFANNTATRNAGSHYAVYAASNVADVSGTRLNYGGYFKASGATTNRAIYTDGGDVLFNNNSGVTKFKFDADNDFCGFGTTAPTQRLHVSGNAIITGLVRMGDGTAASPSYQFESDTNTGMWRPASDTIAVSTGGTERTRITSGGQQQRAVQSDTTANTASPSHAVDFNNSNLQKLTLGGTSVTDPTLTSSNLAAGRTVRLLIVLNGAALSSISLPSGWTEFGDDVSFGASYNVLIELTSWGTTDSDVTANIKIANE